MDTSDSGTNPMAGGVGRRALLRNALLGGSAGLIVALISFGVRMWLHSASSSTPPSPGPSSGGGKVSIAGAPGKNPSACG